MKSRLMYMDKRSMTESASLEKSVLIRDLLLAPVLSAMADGDRRIRESAEQYLLSPLTDRETILYRQEVMEDVMGQPQIVKDLYAEAVAAVEEQKAPELRFHESLGLSALFSRSRRRLKILLGHMEKLERIGRESSCLFHSGGFSLLFADWQKNMGPDFFCGAEKMMTALEFPRGMYVRTQRAMNGSAGVSKLLYAGKSAGPAAYVPDRENSRGREDMLHREEAALSKTTAELVRAVSGITEYLEQLSDELAFFLGGLHLAGKLRSRGVAVSFPQLNDSGWSGRELMEVCTALTAEHPVGNTFSIPESCVITGADIGGKTTFLRSLAQAQLLLQTGLFVPAEEFTGQLVSGIFTHFQREEDPSLVSGKLAEELDRMAEIVREIRPGAALYTDESFCSTNEKEGSEIAEEITGALREGGTAVFAVTHLYPFARAKWEKERDSWTFLCAERLEKGERTFRILPGEPRDTAFSEDIFREIYGEKNPWEAL